MIKTKGLNARDISPISPKNESEVVVVGNGRKKGFIGDREFFNVTSEKYDKKTKTYYYELEPISFEEFNRRKNG